MGQAIRWFTALLALAAATCACAGTDDFDARLAQGAQWRRAGQTHQALALLTTTSATARTPDQRMRAAAELGLTLAQERRFDEARTALAEAYQLAQGEPRAAYALELGNLAARTHDDEAAARYLAKAGRADDARLRLAAALNLLRIRPEAERLPALQTLAPAVAAQGDVVLLASLGRQAQALGETGLAWRSWEQARRAAAPGSRAQLDALDGLAGLYESRGQIAEALSLDQAGLAALAGQPIASVGELAIELEWRNARLHKAQGQAGAALAAYQRAADRLEALRADIPIELDDGSTSYGRWFEPIYLGLSERRFAHWFVTPHAPTAIVRNGAGLPGV